MFSGYYFGFYVELSIPTWIIAVSAAAVAVVSIYAPPVGAAMTKIIATLHASKPVAAALLSALTVCLIASYAK